MAKGPGRMYRHRPGVVFCFALAAAALMSACANTSLSTAPAPAPAQPSLQEWMQQAQSASREGQRERARQAWRSAAKAYPTQKTPWQRLAEDYFEAADYGNAILAAQEVLQRDDQDTLAHSVLAVSGLRLSTVSLVALRERTSYPVGSREEAVGLTRAMREALGENALVPLRTTESATATVRGGTAATSAATPAARNPAPTIAARAASGAAPAATAATTSRPSATAATTSAARSPSATPTGVMPVVAPAPASPQAKPAADPFKLLK